ncbi:ester cyclase [Mucilaginibacter sp. X5P1]|uniref:ester cyclase n=1 Tax=Mucilaginibacter sp. X5P1 TaxID=2723088 RepID=UPI0016193178|nr:ester cyclase [Mucilaginibacter sp. X5P1]MBB6139994.1 putative ester cyclase/heme-degrading monooxygenase HmoA [Mucilaginibacter sp. X5P1]
MRSSTCNKLYLLLAMLAVSEITMAQVNGQNKKMEVQMLTVQKNETIARELYEQILNKKEMKMLKGIIADDYTGPNGLKGTTGFEAPIAPLIKAFPDIEWTIDAIIADGDKVVVSSHWHGTQTGDFQHIKATGKYVSNSGIVIYEFKDGKIISANVLTDRLSFLQQLDILPQNIAALANNKADSSQVIFIDRFIVPSNAWDEFIKQTTYNRSFIKSLPGFVRDNGYESHDDKGNILFTTTAVWENQEALNKAKEAVQAEYKRIGFNPPEMLQRLGITMDRAIYKNFNN